MLKGFLIILFTGIITAIASEFYVPLAADLNFEQVLTVITGVEAAKQDNGSVYPAMDKTEFAKTANIISDHLGGVKYTTDLMGWTYECLKVDTSDTTTVTISRPIETLKIADYFYDFREKMSKKFPKLKIDPTRSSVKIADSVRATMQKTFQQWQPDAPGSAIINISVKNTYCK